MGRAKLYWVYQRLRLKFVKRCKRIIFWVPYDDF